MKKNIFLLFLLFTAVSLQAQYPLLSKDAEISLLTVSPSEDEVYTVYGHTALRVRDASKKLDTVFNYGIFDFSKPNFIYRFAKGETDYRLAAQYTRDFLIEYEMRGSEVTEQILDIDSAGKARIWEALMINNRPENRVYRYNFFFDNCATRPAAIIEKLAGGKIDVLNYFVALLVVSRIYDPLTTSLDNLTAILATDIPCRRMDEILSGEEQTGVETLSNQGCDIQFEHVAFSYNKGEKVLQDVSFTAKQGEVTALIGPSGGGKTTISRLAARFWDVDSGKITVGGMDVSKVDPETLMSLYSIVFQDVTLFNNTIMENIRYGRLDATDEEVIAAAKAANADHFIRTLPGGYQMELNEDASNVSQGQKQLLTIARAILADNRILILDEATSSVDTRTEQRIQTAMDNLMRGRTSFVIAHRLSTIRDADLILVMRDGDIVEQGTHDQLIEKGGFYADLYNSQFEDVVE